MTTQLIESNSLSLRPRGESRAEGPTRPLHPLLPWMLVLLPGNVLVALDLARGVVRFDTWLLRFAPAMFILGFIAWAEFTRSPAATRLRTELRLAMPTALPMLLLSGASLCSDAYARDGAWGGFIRTAPALLLLFVPGAALIAPWSTELRARTWEHLLTQPRGRRVLFEKYVLSVSLVVNSAVQLTALLERDADLFTCALLGHFFAAASTLPLFLVVRHGFMSVMLTGVLGAAVLASGDLAYNWPVAGWVSMALVFATTVVLLVLTPRGLRRLPLVEAELGSTPPAAKWLTLSWPWRAELEPQRLLLALPFVGVLAMLGATFDGQEGAALPLIVCCATVALMSPGIVFSEARRLGTLDPLLAVLPRRVVFQRKLVASGLFTFATCVALPAVAMAVMPPSTSLVTDGNPPPLLVTALAEGMVCLVAMGFLFSVGLVVANFTTHAAVTLSMGAGAALVLAVAQTALAVGSVFLLRDEFLDGPLLAASFVGTSLVLVAMAWLHFSGRIRSSRVLTVGVATCLVQALALAVVGSFLPR